ncbi:hypothetical protein K2P56_02370 [Patescibacteria group bacterium]|nr:hypothetical protein [Patescibacteria group bacterium]
MAGEYIRVSDIQGIRAFQFGKHIFDAVQGVFVGASQDVVYAKSFTPGKVLSLEQGKIDLFRTWLQSARSEQ